MSRGKILVGCNFTIFPAKINDCLCPKDVGELKNEGNEISILDLSRLIMVVFVLIWFILHTHIVENVVFP